MISIELRACGESGVHVLFSDRFKTREDPPKYVRGSNLSLFNLNPKEFPRARFFRNLMLYAH
jgi:hypothetical protein